MRGRGADPDPAPLLGDAAELRQLADVHQLRGLGQPEAHHRQERVPAGEQLAPVARGEGVERVPHRLGAHVVEGGRDHRAPPSAFAAWIAAQTPAGVRGSSLWGRPSGASASPPAFTRHAAEAMVPASPIPLTPSGLTGDGVSRWSVSIAGIWLALGTA